MSLRNRVRNDRADPLIRMTLRNWAMRAHMPVYGKKRLLQEAWLLCADHEGKAKASGMESGQVVGTLWELINAAFADPAGNSVQRALAGAPVQDEPNVLLTGHIRREGWHPFSLGIGLLTVIR